jgi:LmbE family N-acetylglucosaminyl deacetylase
MRSKLSFIFACILSSSLCAQSSSTHILQQLHKLEKTATVLYIAAHPDDENTRLLSYLSNELHLRTAYLSLTRGDGGQNLIGDETEEALGIIRTQELLAARRVDGAEQYFTRAFDFGYSKTPEETFRIWNKDSVLHDVVWIIRKLRPDVIITRFPTTGEGGHGHHTASAMLAEQAFAAAANKNMFPEQLKYTEVWQAKRLYWNNFMPSRDEKTDTRHMLKLDVGAYNSLLGLSMGEVASLSRSQHKSQGFGVKKQRGTLIEYFTYQAGDSATASLFEGIQLGYESFKNHKEIEQIFVQINKAHSVQYPEKTIPLLVELDALLKKSCPSAMYQVKHQHISELIKHCAGVFTDFISPAFKYCPNDTLTATLSIIKRNVGNVVLKKLSCSNQFIEFGKADSLNTNSLTEKKLFLKIPTEIGYSNPYWLQKAHSEGLFTHPLFSITGTAESPAPLTAELIIEINGFPLNISLPLQYKWVDPVKGELLRKVEIVPPLVAHPALPVVVNTGSDICSIELRLDGNKANLNGTIQLVNAEQWGIRALTEKIKIKPGLMSQTIRFDVELKPTRALRDAFTAPLTFSFTDSMSGKTEALLQTRKVAYDHIPTQTWHQPCLIRYVYAPMKREVSRIGYVEGAGDEVAEALMGAGYKVEILGDAQIKKLHPDDFEAVVVGIRALNSEERIGTWMPYLLEYCRKGGTLVMQYNTRNWISDVKVQPGPYPFEISRNRITDETAEVRFTQKDAPILNSPNIILQSDFSYWVQERGVYFVEKCAPEYSDVLRMNDPGDKEFSGALITAPFGEGTYVYTGLSFFRQLPAGVPGAFKLFANLIAAGKNEKY